jgi:IS4 transposase
MAQAHEADKHSKGFGSWDQLLAMVYAQLSGAESLRTLSAGFNAQTAHHYHLATRTIQRSTLADANNKRPVGLFVEIAQVLMRQVSRKLQREGKACLQLLDSTSITLRGAGFDGWTAAARTQHTQGIKLHVVYLPDAAVPAQVSLSMANVNDIEAGRRFMIEPKTTYVFDKGYCDYNWWAQIDAKEALFVTRFKANAALGVESTRSIPDADRTDVLQDDIVRFSNKQPRGGRRNNYRKPLRRVVIARPDHDTPLVLATNDLASPARIIAQHYKDRWQIELFFKWIKQHLKVKRYLGRSQNAVYIQILCALIAYLLLATWHRAHAFAGSLWTCLAEIRATLFQRPGVEAAANRRRREHLVEMRRTQAVLFV